MKKNYLMAVCLFLVVMSGCGNKGEVNATGGEPVKVKVITEVSSVRNETVRFSGTVRGKTGSSFNFPADGTGKVGKGRFGKPGAAGTIAGYTG